jgi:hypothetical protein
MPSPSKSAVTEVVGQISGGDPEGDGVGVGGTVGDGDAGAVVGLAGDEGRPPTGTGCQ